MRAVCHSIVAPAVVALALCLSSCKREERGFRVDAPDANAAQFVRLSDLQPGGAAPDQPVKNELEENAYAMGEGQKLFDAFNCSGCHAHGAGGMGPALMDDKWIYGSEPAQVYSTIIQGRPNGMPSYRGKINNMQAWQLVAFVRSMSGLVNTDAAPGRDDHMKGADPPNSTTPEEPKNSNAASSPGSPPK